MTDHEIDVEVAKIAKEDGWALPDANLIEFGRKVWLRRLGASGVDVEGLARRLKSAAVIGAVRGDMKERFEDILRKHIAQPAAPKCQVCGNPVAESRFCVEHIPGNFPPKAEQERRRDG